MHALKIAGAITLVSIGMTAAAARAADLPVAAPAAAIASPVLSGFYAEIYGGGALAGTLDALDSGAPSYTEQMNAGWAFGGAIGMETGVSGLSVEADVFHTRRDESGYPDYILDTTSVMANAKYTFHLSDSFDLYAGAGLGGINFSYDEGGTTYSGWGLGYQVMAGAAVNVSDSVSLFGEYRFQNTFSHIGLDSTYSYALPNSSILAGLKFKF